MKKEFGKIMPKIKIDNLHKYYEDKKSKTLVAALYDVNLFIPDKSFTAIVGPSGCGKTTLIKTLIGLYKPDDGFIYYDDIKMNDVTTQSRNISFVSQEFALYPNKTIFENIAYPLKLLKLPMDELTSRVKEVSNLLELDILLSRKPRVLSGGQQQRVALARALVKNPDIVVLDEPLANLDAKMRLSILKKLGDWYKKWNVNIIYVTHKLNEAKPFINYLVEMDNGTVINQMDVI